MPKFMAAFTVPDPTTEDKLAELPAERARIRELMQQGSLEHIFVAADFSEGWIIFAVDSPETVHALMDTLPMRRHMNLRVIELLS
jgi:muconolactone delta-isomerase